MLWLRDIKITLMEHYPDDFPVKIVTGAHSTGASVLEVPLFELDHHEDAFNNLTSVYVPKVTNDEVLYRNFDYAVEIIDRLVDDETGCPWDRVQTHASLKRYLLEESFELFEAIDNEDDWHMIEELEISYFKFSYMQVLAKEGYMDIQEIIESLSAKMIRRHPHILVMKSIDRRTK